MSGHSRAHVPAPTPHILLAALLCASLLAPGVDSRQRPFERPVKLSKQQSEAVAHSAPTLSIPAGTILPVELRSTLSPEKSKPGQTISGRIMQDVPLPAGVRIKAGSKVLGRVVAVTPASASASPSISLQFDQLMIAGQTISIATNLRAIAGFVRIE